MQKPEAIYTRDNCNFAYQLNWGLSVFWRSEVRDDAWLKELAIATEQDGIRVLKHRFIKPVVLFLPSHDTFLSFEIVHTSANIGQDFRPLMISGSSPSDTCIGNMGDMANKAVWHSLGASIVGRCG